MNTTVPAKITWMPALCRLKSWTTPPAKVVCSDDVL